MLAHPPFGVWWLALLALAPLAAALEGVGPRAAFAAGWAASVGMGLGVAHWVLHALVVEYGVAAPAAAAVLIGRVGLYALVPAAAFALHAALRPRVPAAAAPLLLAALFSAAEWLRAGPLGLPWILAAHAVAPAPLLLQTADLGGATAVGFAVSAVGAGVGIALARRRPGPLLGPALVLALATGYGALRLAEPVGEGAPVRVGVVQASVPQRERFRPGSARANTRRHIDLTRALLAEGPVDLVVWSETAVDDDLDANPDLFAALRALVEETGVPLLTGAPRSSGGRPINAVLLLEPGGAVETYAKQVLVPFAESDPPGAAWLAPLLGPVMEGEPYRAGMEATVLRGGPLPLGAPVCFEITYPGLVRRFREGGARLIVNLSNDAWFGRTGYPEMHFRHGVLRAVELRTWVVRGANTGVSAVVDPAGRVVARLPLFHEGTLRADVWPTGTRTLFGRAGDGPVLAVLAGVVGGALLAGRAARPGPPGGGGPGRPAVVGSGGPTARRTP